MKAQLKVNAKIIVEVEGDTHADLFQEIATAQEIYFHEKCGCCGNSNIEFVVRKDKDDHEYFELHCRTEKCWARLPFGQAEKPKGSLYPKRRWNSLSSKPGGTGLSEQQRRASEKEYADNHGGFLPNGGWFKYKKEDKE